MGFLYAMYGPRMMGVPYYNNGDFRRSSSRRELSKLLTEVLISIIKNKKYYMENGEGEIIIYDGDIKTFTELCNKVDDDPIIRNHSSINNCIVITIHNCLHNMILYKGDYIRVINNKITGYWNSNENTEIVINPNR